MNPNGLEQFWGYVEAGGLVMPPLVVATLVLWYVLGLRLVTLQRGAVEGLPVLVQHGLEGTLKPRGVVARAVSDAVEIFRWSSDQLRTRLDEALYPHQQAIKVGQTVVRVIVLTAPLAGLLGTVSGMIETFDSLADMAMFTQTGGIAAGISQALITTQMGLIVAAPGVVVGRILEKRQHLIEDELERIKDMFCAMEAP